MGSSSSLAFQVKHVAIIGAGPSGLAAAKYLRAQSAFDTITIFEQQDQVGGNWNYNDTVPKNCPVPQEDPFHPPDSPIRCREAKAPIFPSSMYYNLHTNIPKPLMTFSDQTLPEQFRIFPDRRDIQSSLLEYARDVRSLIKFCFQVVSLSPVQSNGQERWRLRAQSTIGDQPIDEIYDAVGIAIGHYNLPFIPAIENIKLFQEAYPSVITHSRHYRRADAFKDKKTIIVGNGPSGLDIALQIHRVSKGKTLLSVRTPTPADKLAHTGCDEVPEIEVFLVKERGVRFKDGRVETGVDCIVFCTGYLYSCPFLHDLQHKLITTGRGVHGLYQHIFCIQHPTLAFLNLTIKAIPWSISEAQAAVISGVWSNNLELPTVRHMQDWSRRLEQEKSPNLHLLGPPVDGLYINYLHDWAIKSRHLGKEPPRWDDEVFWIRKIFMEAKLIFEQQGGKAKSLAELGLHYSPKDDVASHL